MMKRNTRRMLSAMAFCLAAACLTLAVLGILTVTTRAKREANCYDLVVRYSEEFSVSPALVMAIIRTESDFNPRAVSAAGACGLMQLMPETFRFVEDMLLGSNAPDRMIYDPEENIRCGCCYLARLLNQFYDTRTALAAYNAGEGRVREWLSDPEICPDGVLADIPFPETEKYVAKTMEAETAYREKYDFD